MIAADVENLDDTRLSSGDRIVDHTVPGLDSGAEGVDEKRRVLCRTRRVRLAQNLVLPLRSKLIKIPKDKLDRRVLSRLEMPGLRHTYAGRKIFLLE